MFNWLNNFQLEKISFFIGFISATILWLIFQNIKKWFPSINEFIKNTAKLIRQQQLSGILISIKKYSLNKAQNNHLANQLFSHDEISIKPKLLALKQDFRIDKENVFVSEIETLIPYSPDTPFVSRNYPVPELTIAEALQKQANLIITGISGIGKTFTLADLVVSICLQKPESGELINKTPLYFDVQDLAETHFSDEDNSQKIHKILFDVFFKKINPNNKFRLERFIQTELNEDNIILVIDGFDLLSKNEFDTYKIFLEQAIEEYQDIQIVITASTYWADLETLNFIPLAVKPFSNSDIGAFYKTWIDKWDSEIASSESDQASQNVVLYNWISKFKPPLTKLEYTLLIWGALEGNLRGTNTLSLYENYFIKLLGNKLNREKIGELAHDFIEKGTNLVKLNQILNNPILGTFIDQGIVGITASNFYYFKHPDLLGYLASFYSFDPAHQISLQDLYSWSTHLSYYGFRVSTDSNNEWADQWIFDDFPPLFHNLLIVGNWLRHTSPKSSFRSKLIKKLIFFIQNNAISVHIRLRLLSIFALANENSASLFLKQMLNSDNDDLKTLGALAAGIFTLDNKIIPDLINSLDTRNIHLQKSICLALSTFDSDLAMHSLGKILLSGDENIRKLIAENLATKPGDGHDILKDAMTMDDILVRRSALFGLIHINEPWAFEIIEKTSIEDSQWVVRNVAAQALETMYQKETKPIPEKYSPYYENAWLIEFASTLQQGVSSDIPPTNILHQALKDKNVHHKLNALHMVNRYFDESFYPEIYQAIFSKDRDLNEISAVTLYSLICSGKKIPSPHQFGLF